MNVQRPPVTVVTRIPSRRLSNSAYVKPLSVAILLSLGLMAMSPRVGAEAQEPAKTAAKKKTWIRVNPRRSEFLLFSSAGQTFTGKFRDSAGSISGNAGAVLSIDENRPVLHAGRVLCSATRGDITVTTRLATAVVPEGCSAW